MALLSVHSLSTHYTGGRGTVRAVDDVSLGLNDGDRIGVVGRNGQGKSTLLKLVAGVLLPDDGKVTVHGGVAPLIEITGGFVGDLTVRENVRLTAGLHGMSKAAIARRFDDIIGFGVGSGAYEVVSVDGRSTVRTVAPSHIVTRAPAAVTSTRL